jgi:hypothetical protein
MQIADFRRRQTPLYGHRMNLGRLTPLKTTGRRAVAAAPAAMAVTLAAMGVAMSASSTPRPDIDRTAEAVARATGGDLGPDGLAAVTARMDAGQLAIARRHDPALGLPELYGLTPGWESLTLGGKPSLGSGRGGRRGAAVERRHAQRLGRASARAALPVPPGGRGVASSAPCAA